MARFLRCTLAVGVLVSVILPGCAASTHPPKALVFLTYPHAASPTLTQSPHEHFQYISSIAAQDEKALVEDLDLLFLTDRPSRLTRWHSR